MGVGAIASGHGLDGLCINTISVGVGAIASRHGPGGLCIYYKCGVWCHSQWV